MRTLSLTFSCSTGSVACADNGAVLSVSENSQPRSHGEHVSYMIQSCLKDASWRFSDIERIVVDVGPGSFTGIRVALSVAKAMGVLLQVRLTPASSLELMRITWMVEHRDSAVRPSSCVALMNAYRDLVFMAAWNSRGEKVLGECMMPWLQAQDWMLNQLSKNAGAWSTMNLLGDGFATYYSKWSRELVGSVTPSSVHFPSAKASAIWGSGSLPAGTQTLDWKSLNPLYIRPSGAEETAEPKQ